MVIATKLMTANELLRMPHGNFRWELLKGELIQMTPAGAKHGTIANRLDIKLGVFVQAKKLGIVCAAETGFILKRNPDTVRGADVSFISTERIPLGGPPSGYWQFAPDLAVEVISPNDTASEVQTKVIEYLEAGTRLVWVVDPESKTVSSYRSLDDVRVLTLADSLDGADVVPGFVMPVKELFEQFLN